MEHDTQMDTMFFLNKDRKNLMTFAELTKLHHVINMV